MSGYKDTNMEALLSERRYVTALIKTGMLVSFIVVTYI
jgi:hypothetical protein